MKQKMFGKTTIVFVLLIISTILGGCATHSLLPGDKIPGFFTGLLHGFLIFFNFIISLFTDYKIYSFPNTGGWYDFGFLIGASMFFGGGGAGTCKRKK